MKLAMLSLLLASVLTITPRMALAEESQPLSFNVSATSDYRYRGISQSRLKPALQGGADYAFSGGSYVGVWASTIKWIKDGGGGADMEIDLYGGHKGQLGDSLGYDIGLLHYGYPSNRLNPSANTTEAYAALSFGPASLKYSHAISNLFGFADSKRSGYLEASATFEIAEGLTLTPHIGRQSVRNNSGYAYTDYSLTLNKDYAGLSFGLGLVGADTKAYSGAGKDLAKAGLVFSLKKAL